MEKFFQAIGGSQSLAGKRVGSYTSIFCRIPIGRIWMIGGLDKIFLKNLWLIWQTRSAAPSASLRAKGFFMVTIWRMGLIFGGVVRSMDSHMRGNDKMWVEDDKGGQCLVEIMCG